MKQRGYDPSAYMERSPLLRSAVELIESGLFNPNEPGIFDDITESLRHSDPYLVCADFDAYVDAHARAGERYLDRTRWQHDSLVNIARSGRFSSDRAIREYADDIWGLTRVRV